MTDTSSATPSFFGKAVSVANFETKLIQIKIWKYVGLLALTIIPMAFINWLFGVPGAVVNLLFMFTVVYFFSFVGLKPAMISLFAVIGAVVNDLADKDRSQGVLEGLKLQQLIVFTVLVVYANIVMLLSIVPFGYAIWAIPVILAAATITGMAGAVLGSGKALFTWSYRINLIIMVASTLMAIGMAFSEGKPITGGINQTVTRSETLPTTVRVPHCSEGWSNPLPLVNTYLTWPEKWPVRYELTDSGSIKQGEQFTRQISDRKNYPKGETVMFCTHNIAYAGRLLPLTWTAK